jgi:hypothetical protein
MLNIKEQILSYLHDNAEYFSACFTYIISFVSLNLHFSHIGAELFIKIASGMISITSAVAAAILVHFIKRYLDRKHK